MRTCTASNKGGGVEKGRPQLLQLSCSSAAAAQQSAADSGPAKSITDRNRIIKPSILGLECSPTQMKPVKLPHNVHHNTPSIPFISEKKGWIF